MLIADYPLLKDELLEAMINQCEYSDHLNIRITSQVALCICQAWRLDNQDNDYSAELLQELEWDELSNLIAVSLTTKAPAVTAEAIIKVAQNELILDRIEERLIHQMDAIYDSYKADNK